MKRAIPLLWFVFAGLNLIAAITVPLLENPQLSWPVLRPTMISALQPISNSIVAVALGFIYMLVFRTAPSRGTVLLGGLHFTAAVLSACAYLGGDVIRRRLVAGTLELSQGGQHMTLFYGVAALLALSGWLLLIVALSPALKKPGEPIADTF